MGANGSRSLNRAFLPGQAVAPPGEQADLADLEARVGVLEAANVDLTARVVALEARTQPTAGQLVPIGTGAIGDTLHKTGANTSAFSTALAGDEAQDEAPAPEQQIPRRSPRAKHT
jgi:hypothetical protein